jgi:hypothetical protein
VPEEIPLNDETQLEVCRQYIQRDVLAYLDPKDILKNPKTVFSMLHHSTHFWLTNQPAPVNQEGAYSRSPFQRNKNARFYYKITMGIPDGIRKRLQLYTPDSPQPRRLTDQTLPGQYSGISIPEDLYAALLRHTIVYGRAITGGELELVFDGRAND